MTGIEHALYWVAAAIVVGVIVAYVKRNPKISAELQAEFDKLHVASEHLMDHLRMVHSATLAPVTVAVVPATVQPAAPPVAAPAPAPAQPSAAAPVNTTDPTAPGFVAPPAAPAPEAAPAAPAWVPTPVMAYADCTGQNIPLNPGTTYTITDCPVATIVGTNITTLPCDPYVLTVNGSGTPHPVQTGQCTVYASGSTVVVSVAPMTPGGTVNLIMQIH